MFIHTGHDRFDVCRCGARIGEEFERIAHLHQIITGGVLAHDLDAALRVPDFAHSGGVIWLHDRPQLAQKVEVFGLVLGIEVQLVIIRVHGRCDGGIALIARQRRVRPQLFVVNIKIDRIKAEPVHPTIQPEPGHIKQCLLHVRFVKIQVRLRRQEVVQEILLALATPLPARPTKDRQPVVWRRAVLIGISPDIPVGFVVLAVHAALLEPRMLIGRMRQHQINHDLEPMVVRRSNHRIKIAKGAKHRIDIAIIANVVAEIFHR